MEGKEQYKKVIGEIIAKQSIILGPHVALLKAKNVSSIKLSDDGEVVDISGDPSDALQKLIDQYVELSGQIVKNALGPIFKKYPSVKTEIGV